MVTFNALLHFFERVGLAAPAAYLGEAGNARLRTSVGDGTLKPLSNSEWHARWKTFEKEHAGWLAQQQVAAKERRERYHAAALRSALESGHTFAAEFHQRRFKPEAPATSLKR